MANPHPIQDRQDRNMEVPGDTNSADIVGRTGEEMPRQSHDGIALDDGAEPDDSTPRVVETDEDDQDASGYPI